ncbi:MAG: glycosyltransferase [Oscillochloridaceae bacterium umkhey_bin13]
MAKRISAPQYGAYYSTSDPFPAALVCGEALLIELHVTNTGMLPWDARGAHPVALAYIWREADGGVALEGNWTPLGIDVAVGAAHQLEVRIETPGKPGSYQLELGLVVQGVAWLRDLGVDPLTVAITLQHPHKPRVTVINGNCVAHDAVGGHVVAQLLALRAAGYLPLLLTEFVDDRLPRDVRRSMITLNRYHYANPDARVKPALEHFRQSEIVIVNYSTYYDLVELIREIRWATIIFDYHGVTPPEHWGPEWPGYQNLVQGRDNLNLVRYADYGIGHSQFTCDELIATGQIAASRVSLMPYAVIDEAGYAGAPDPAVLERFGLTGKYVLLYVGRMARNKGVSDLVAALPLILAQYPETVLLLVGDNKLPAYKGYADEVQAQAEALGVAAHVIFAGQVDDATLEACYRACTVFVTASLHEGFCMPVVEAMARGRPVVATNTTALPHTLGGAGLLFDPHDGVTLAAHIKTLLAELPPPDKLDDPLTIHRLEPASAAELAALRERPLAVVTPRYGPQVLGGAESGLRAWAEQLAARGYPVEALSTATLYMDDWADQLSTGVEVLNGVTVRRFSTDKVDAGMFHITLLHAASGEHVRYSEEARFMANNLRSSALEQYVREHAEAYSCLIYTPYLFGTCYWPVMAAPTKAVLVPCLHDEPAARLIHFREMLESAAALFFNTEVESAFASTALQVANPYRTSIGYGFPDIPLAGDAQRFRATYGLEEPVLLYSGRLEHAKNVPLLLDYFVRYKAERPAARLTLVLAGNGDVLVPQRPDILPLGMISDAQALADAYAAAMVLCQPSLNESFSIVIMEAWQQGTPVMVHADCAVTRDHVERSGGGFAFAHFAAFSAALDELLAAPTRVTELGAAGQAYVQQRYAWSNLLDRFEQNLALFSRPRSRYSHLSQQGVVRALAFTRQRFADALLDLVDRARADLPVVLHGARYQELAQAALVTRPSYVVQSRMPLLGRLIAWIRRQLTAHLKEPYLDPIIMDQEAFNRELVTTLIPALEESLREQRRLRAEVEMLREEVRNAHNRLADPKS